ncbi:hypothetical protein SISNIDRAFT_468327 [Sistotremastrum niveocremeum HHB9708]|uniref:Uncharacterized protein n=1 Tax=Sistotremastrum niveocremeum HHB9708 TaxID=1314777 RepID=A0A164RRW9_9AGAM|nr:hypothetical protein SISNIDRAFT_468327 [Sistotremastrum niveocremeum HHB9708]
MTDLEKDESKENATQEADNVRAQGSRAAILCLVEWRSGDQYSSGRMCSNERILLGDLRNNASDDAVGDITDAPSMERMPTSASDPSWGINGLRARTPVGIFSASNFQQRRGSESESMARIDCGGSGGEMEKAELAPKRKDYIDDVAESKAQFEVVFITELSDISLADIELLW